MLLAFELGLATKGRIVYDLASCIVPIENCNALTVGWIFIGLTNGCDALSLSAISSYDFGARLSRVGDVTLQSVSSPDAVDGFSSSALGVLA